MYAVIKTGGKQYKVAAADLIKVERLAGKAGESVAFDQVLAVGDDADVTVGSPLVAGASVAGEIVDQTRGDKILVFKKRRRKSSKRTRGHRQELSVVRITEILTGGRAASPKPAPAPEAATPPAETSAEAPAAEAASPAAAADGDDLTKISGVGPALQEKLRALGVTTYAQIAAWSEDDVARIDDSLNFKGRIARDDWIAQARQLMADKT